MKKLLTVPGVSSVQQFLARYARASRQFRDTFPALAVGLVLCLPITQSRADVVRDWCERVHAHRHVALHMAVDDLLMPALCGEVGMIFSETAWRGDPINMHREDLDGIGAYRGICVHGVSLGGM